MYKKIHINENQYSLLFEERGVFPEVEEFSYKLAKEYIKQAYEQRGKGMLAYCSKYKFLGHDINILQSFTNTFACYVDRNGGLNIEVMTPYAAYIDNFAQIDSSIKNDFIGHITHEFTHALQTLYAQEKSNGKNLKFNTSYPVMTDLYIFSYGEMQARLSQLFGTKSNSVEISKDKNPTLLIDSMRYIIDKIKKYNNISPDYKLFTMKMLSNDASKGFHFSNVGKEDDIHEFISNNYPYLKNVTEENYEKKYEILVRDLEKRYKWFLSRVYYWRNKLNNERHDILDRNIGMDKYIEK
jgi:hypothetical protein